MKTEAEEKQQQQKKKKILENQSKSLLVELLECLRVNRMQRFLQKVFFIYSRCHSLEIENKFNIISFLNCD